MKGELESPTKMPNSIFQNYNKQNKHTRYLVAKTIKDNMEKHDNEQIGKRLPNIRLKTSKQMAVLKHIKKREEQQKVTKEEMIEDMNQKADNFQHMKVRIH